MKAKLLLTTFAAALVLSAGPTIAQNKALRLMTSIWESQCRTRARTTNWTQADAIR